MNMHIIHTHILIQVFWDEIFCRHWLCNFGLMCHLRLNFCNWFSVCMIYPRLSIWFYVPNYNLVFVSFLLVVPLYILVLPGWEQMYWFVMSSWHFIPFIIVCLLLSLVTFYFEIYFMIYKYSYTCFSLDAICLEYPLLPPSLWVYVCPCSWYVSPESRILLDFVFWSISLLCAF